VDKQVKVFWNCRLQRGYTGDQQKGEYHLYGRYPTKNIASAILTALRVEHAGNIEFNTLVKLAEAGDKRYSIYYNNGVDYRVQYDLDGEPLAVEIVGGHEYYP